MIMGEAFRYIQQQEINRESWDKCIREASNGLVYAFSWYLDSMAEKWDALVFGDYELVFPLTWRKKFGIYYLYQPAFTPQLGLFGNNITCKHIEMALLSIPSKFRLVEISLNEGNSMLSEIPSVRRGSGKESSLLPEAWKILNRQNYILPLEKNFDQLWGAFRQNIKRNVRKARDLGCTYTHIITVEQVEELSKGLMKQKTNLTDGDYDRFRKLYFHLSNSRDSKLRDRKSNEGHFENHGHQLNEGLDDMHDSFTDTTQVVLGNPQSNSGHALVRGVVSNQGELLASAVFFLFHGRAYYILAGNHPNGKTLGASHLLLASFIEEHAGRPLVLDFEGSSIPGLAFFYESFGSELKVFPAVRMDRLPWWVKLVKR